MLTDQEMEVIRQSAELYNSIARLPDKHSSDMAETVLDIHRIQNRIMARAAVRLHPEIFGSD